VPPRREAASNLVSLAYVRLGWMPNASPCHPLGPVTSGGTQEVENPTCRSFVEAVGVVGKEVDWPPIAKRSSCYASPCTATPRLELQSQMAQRQPARSCRCCGSRKLVLRALQYSRCIRHWFYSHLITVNTGTAPPTLVIASAACNGVTVFLSKIRVAKLG